MINNGRTRKVASAFGAARPNLRNVCLGVMILVVAAISIVFYFTHLNVHTREKSMLMDRIAKLETSLSKHHQNDHSALNQDVLADEKELELLKTQVSRAELRAQEGDSLIQRLQDRIRTLEFGMTQHETHHKERVDPKVLSDRPPRSAEELLADPGGKATMEEFQNLIRHQMRELQGQLDQHNQHHRQNVDPKLHNHPESSGTITGGNVANAIDNGMLLRGSTTATTATAAGGAGIGSASGGAQGTALGSDTVLLIMASNREQYLKRCLSKVVHYHPHGGNVPIVISEDGANMQMREVINNARKELQASDPSAQLIHLNHKAGAGDRGTNGYFALSAHFKWALTQVFDEHSVIGLIGPRPARVIILEEDLEIAPDFYGYFAAVAPMVDTDLTLLAASAWNDNGQERNVRDPSQLYRSDFFPGLGWLMPRRIWLEIGPKWPRAYWDDWLREPKNRLNRHTLRPEVCRTLHYGIRGVSNAQYQSNWMTDIRLNDVPVDFTKLDLSYLQPNKWEDYYIENHVKKAHLTTTSLLDQARIRDKVSPRTADSPASLIPVQEYRVEYEGNSGFEHLAKWAKAMDNIKANVPRTAYKGVVSIWFGDAKLYLVPKGLL